MRDIEKLTTKKTIPIYTPTRNVSGELFPEILIINIERYHFLIYFWQVYRQKYATNLYISYY